MSVHIRKQPPSSHRESDQSFRKELRSNINKLLKSNDPNVIRYTCAPSKTRGKTNVVLVNGSKSGATVGCNLKRLECVPGSNGKSLNVFLMLSPKKEDHQELPITSSDPASQIKSNSNRAISSRNKQGSKNSDSEAAKLSANETSTKPPSRNKQCNKNCESEAPKPFVNEPIREHFPEDIPDCVLNYNASTRMKMLANPPKDFFEGYRNLSISQYALNYTASPRILELAQPNGEISIPFKNRVEDETIPLRALSYRASPRICELAEPKPFFVDSLENVLPEKSPCFKRKKKSYKKNPLYLIQLPKILYRSLPKQTIFKRRRRSTNKKHNQLNSLKPQNKNRIEVISLQERQSSIIQPPSRVITKLVHQCMKIDKISKINHAQSTANDINSDSNSQEQISQVSTSNLEKDHHKNKNNKFNEQNKSNPYSQPPKHEPNSEKQKQHDTHLTKDKHQRLTHKDSKQISNAINSSNRNLTFSNNNQYPQSKIIPCHRNPNNLEPNKKQQIPSNVTEPKSKHSSHTVDANNSKLLVEPIHPNELNLSVPIKRQSKSEDQFLQHNSQQRRSREMKPLQMEQPLPQKVNQHINSREIKPLPLHPANQKVAFASPSHENETKSPNTTHSPADHRTSTEPKNQTSRTVNAEHQSFVSKSTAPQTPPKPVKPPKPIRQPQSSSVNLSATSTLHRSVSNIDDKNHPQTKEPSPKGQIKERIEKVI